MNGNNSFDGITCIISIKVTVFSAKKLGSSQNWSELRTGLYLVQAFLKLMRSAGFCYLRRNMTKKPVKSPKKKIAKKTVSVKSVKLDKGLINPLRLAAKASAAKRTA